MSNIRFNRQSIRLRNYDYTQSGFYFITICAQNRYHYFGEIVGATLRGRPNNPHTMIEPWLFEMEHKFHAVKIGPHVIMPNHIHFIIEKTGDGLVGDHIGSPLQNAVDCAEKHISGDHSSGNHAGSPLRNIVGWFKTMTTNEYIRNVKLGLYEPFEKRLWQRNYYEHIIRDKREYYKIVEYIQNNPARWEQDSMYTEPSHP